MRQHPSAWRNGKEAVRRSGTRTVTDSSPPSSTENRRSGGWPGQVCSGRGSSRIARKSMRHQSCRPVARRWRRVAAESSNVTDRWSRTSGATAICSWSGKSEPCPADGRRRVDGEPAPVAACPAAIHRRRSPYRTVRRPPAPCSPGSAPCVEWHCRPRLSRARSCRAIPRGRSHRRSRYTSAVMSNVYQYPLPDGATCVPMMAASAVLGGVWSFAGP